MCIQLQSRDMTLSFWNLLAYYPSTKKAETIISLAPQISPDLSDHVIISQNTKVLSLVLCYFTF